MTGTTSFLERARNTLAQKTPPATEWELRELLRQAMDMLEERAS